MTTSPRFEDPPPISRSRTSGNVPEGTAQLLQENPGIWMNVVSNAASRGSAYATAFQIRRGILTAFRPPGAYQSRGRTVNGEYRVYARYVGENGEFA